MSNNGRISGSGNTTPEDHKEDLPPVSNHTAGHKTESKSSDGRYLELQSAVRFPIHLPVSVRSESGESVAETENISANGVLFQMDSEIPIGSTVDFTISLPAEVVGSDTNVQLDCRGRVVRNCEEDGHRGVGVVIDEYRFERR